MVFSDHIFQDFQILAMPVSAISYQQAKVVAISSTKLLMQMLTFHKFPLARHEPVRPKTEEKNRLSPNLNFEFLLIDNMILFQQLSSMRFEFMTEFVKFLYLPNSEPPLKGLHCDCKDQERLPCLNFHSQQLVLAYHGKPRRICSHKHA